MPDRATYGQGSVIQRGPRKFTIRWSEGKDPFTGKHIRRTMTLHDVTLTEARRVLALKTAAYHERRNAGMPAISRMTLGQLLEIALPELDIAEATRTRYDYAIKHIPDGAREWRVMQIAVDDAGKLVKGMNERTGAPTVRKAISAVQACWRYGYRRSWLPRDSPFDGLKLPDVERTAGKLISDADIKKLIAVAEPGEEEAWLLVSLGTGARPGEVRQLRWSDVDLSTAIVTFTDTKHRGARRPVAIGDTVVDALAAWKAEQADRADLVDDPFLFSTKPDASVPWSRFYSGRDRWQRLRDRAGVSDVYQLKDLRHTANSNLAASGVSDDVRALRAGNSAVINSRVYTHQHPAADREAAAIMDRWLK